jgi:cytoskeletal protein CcmA (bactofilin family)
MLGKKPIQNKQENYPDTIVSSGMKIEGELKSSGNIMIDGVISGKVHTSQNLEVGPNAQIDADIVAGSAVVAGVIKGNLTIKNSLLILESGKIMGNVSCSSIAIREGAYFNGACRMQEPKQPIAVEKEEETE